MKRTAFGWLIIAGAIVAYGGCAAAEDIDIGKTEYLSACAPCHGADAKGSGPVSKALKAQPTDLTALAKKNSGVFPFDRVYQVIDGRDVVGSHGTREMPIWGYRFTPPHYNLKYADDYVLSPAPSSEGIVRVRILAVIDYLNRIQEK